MASQNGGAINFHTICSATRLALAHIWSYSLAARTFCETIKLNRGNGSFWNEILTVVGMEKVTQLNLNEAGIQDHHWQGQSEASGNQAVYTNSTATGICQVCHARATMSWSSSGSGSNLGHDNGLNCTQCNTPVSGLQAIDWRQWESGNDKAVDTYAGKILVECDPQAAVMPLGQLPFFIAFLYMGNARLALTVEVSMPIARRKGVAFHDPLSQTKK